NIFVNTGGMCCTTSTGTARLAGNALTTRARASGPPVEQPIVMTSIRPVWTVFDRVIVDGAGAAAGLGDTGAAGRVAAPGGAVLTGGGPAGGACGGASGRRSVLSPRRA